MTRKNDLEQPIGFSVADCKGAEPPERAPLKGRYALLEPLNISHAADLFDAFGVDQENRIWTYLPIEPFETLQDCTVWVREAATSLDPQFFAILDQHSGRALGFASYLRIAPENGSIEVGFINFSPALQKSRIATEAMYLMMANAFALGFRRYEWKCDALNAGSRAAAARLGFHFEGIFRQATVYKNRNRDTAWYSIIDTEWPNLRRAFESWLDPANFDQQGHQKQPLATAR
jgi:RimJ/RimL family protein N-acetyltransferase